MTSLPPTAPNGPRAGANARSRELVTVVGIDPGSHITGYGVVRADGPSYTMLSCGVIRPKGESAAARLLDLYDRVESLFAEWCPDEVAVEEPFARVNVRSAFVLGRAQAAAILAAARGGIPSFEYTPAAVKQAVASYGRSTKEQMAEMVRLQFGLAVAPTPADASDALAIALCHLAHRRIAGLAERTR